MNQQNSSDVLPRLTPERESPPPLVRGGRYWNPIICPRRIVHLIIMRGMHSREESNSQSRELLASCTRHSIQSSWPLEFVHARFYYVHHKLIYFYKSSMNLLHVFFFSFFFLIHRCVILVGERGVGPNTNAEVEPEDPEEDCGTIKETKNPLLDSNYACTKSIWVDSIVLLEWLGNEISTPKHINIQFSIPN